MGGKSLTRKRLHQTLALASLVVLYGAIALPVNYGWMPIYAAAVAEAGSQAAALERFQTFVAVMFVPVSLTVLYAAIQPLFARRASTPPDA